MRLNRNGSEKENFMIKGKLAGKRAVLTLALAMMLAATGCSFDKSVSVEEAMEDVHSSMDVTEEDVENVREMSPDKVIMTVDDRTVTYGEVLFYMYKVKQEYESTLGSGVWDVRMQTGETFHNYAKEQILKEITELNIINLKAESEEVKLTDDEVDDVRQQVGNFLKGVSPEDKEKYQFSEEVLQKIYEEHALAEKMYDVTTGQVETTIPNEEVKQVRIQSLFVMTEGVDKNGVEISLSKAEKKKALKKLKEMVKDAKETNTFYNIASTNSDAKQVEYVFGKDNMPEEFGEEAMALKTGEYSDILEKPNGYYVLYCVSDYDEDATQEKKEEIIQDKQDKVFQESYTEWSKEYKVRMSAKIWKKINFYI